MAAINANIVVDTTNLTVTPTTTNLGVVVDPINLNVYSGAFAPAGGNTGELQYNDIGALKGVANTNVDANGNVIFSNLSNVKIDGGTNAYYLQTDGTGNLTWAAGGTPTGSGVPSGANTQIQLSDGSGSFDSGAGFTFDKSSNIFTVPGNVVTTGVFVGDGYGISNIAAANIVGLNVAEIANGTSNVNIPIADGNIEFAVDGVVRGKIDDTGYVGPVATGDLTLTDSFAPLGLNAGTISPPTFGVAVGTGAGENNLGDDSIAIGRGAGNLDQANNSIILNATGANLTTSTANSFTVAPIRTASSTKILYYNDTTKEITADGISSIPVDQIANGTSNVDIATTDGNVTIGVGGTADVLIATTTGVNVTGTLNATGIITGDGSGLSAIAGANVTGEVTNAAVANSVALANVSGAGNIASINLNGDATKYLNGAGAFDTVYLANTANFLVVAGNGALNIGSNSAVQLSGAIAIGKDAAGDTGFAQGANGVALGQEAGYTGQDQGAIAVGYRAGYTQQEDYSVAVGYTAGQDNQATRSVAIGYSAANNTQGSNSVALGSGAGSDTQSGNAVAVGAQAGVVTQSDGAVAVGYGAGGTTQGQTAVAIGKTAQATNAGDNAISIGVSAGQTDQGDQTVAIGALAGWDTQGTYGIAIGHSAGQNDQGANAVAIGHDAGVTSQANNSIIINATGAALDTAVTDTFNVKPVRNAGTSGLPAGFFQVAYNPTTGEFVYYS